MGELPVSTGSHEGAQLKRNGKGAEDGGRKRKRPEDGDGEGKSRDEKRRKQEKQDKKAMRERERRERREREKKEKKEERQRKKFKAETQVVANNEVKNAEDETEAEVQTADTTNPKEPSLPIEDAPKPKKKEKKKKRKSDITQEPIGAVTEPAPAPAKHLAILEKLRKVKEKVSTSTTSITPASEGFPGPGEKEPTPTPAGLTPLPQPAPTKPNKSALPISSALPPWLSAPTIVSPTEAQPFSAIPGISPKLLSRLSALSLPTAFAVQSTVIPLLLLRTAGDVCISAATGSGKTLAYVLPIVQTLSTRVVTRLRAVVVVPTRELVIQVHTVTRSLSVGSGLKIGTAVGSKALSIEQELLVDDEGGGSKVDILICTPGRLVEHIKTTPGFTLRWIKWLVIDEADRLLAQSFQEWVPILMGEIEKVYDGLREEKMNAVLEDLGVRPRRPGDGVRKVILSATMTRDVGKLADLKLRKPTMVAVESPPTSSSNAEASTSDNEGRPDETFTLPPNLVELAVPVLNTEYKPLYLSYILRDRGAAGTLVFVKSNEAAARLSSLLCTFAQRAPASWSVGLVTGEMERKRREKVLRAFAKDEVDVLVCSDLIARGLDLPNVRHVVNYDAPRSTRAYVHRVGRTARAGKEGDALTLLADKEARWFWRNVGRGVKRRAEGIERGVVELEEEGYGWRGVYEGVLYE